MKKLFTFFAAMLVALAVNAAVINITSETPDALRTALNSAESGDEIVMAAGTYVESNGNYIAFTEKNVTVRAAEEALVIIQPQVPITLTNGYATFENIKFDASRLNELASWYEHLIYAADASEGNGLSFVNCEFYNFLINKSMIYCSSSNHLSAVNIQNCYFHDIMKSILFVENTSADISVHIANSTIANITTATGYSAGVIDIRNANAEFNVDHCTFYDAMAMNTDYSAVSKISITGSVVSNCIFMLSTAQDGVRAMRGVTANNCLTYNYLKDSGTGIHSSVTKNNCFQADPLFADAANGDFTLADNSPAKAAGVAGTHLGDPRWWPTSWAPAEVIPVSSVEIDANALTLDVNETAYLHVTVLPNDATDPSVTWSSSDKAVATVVNGAVKGIAAGTATITAKAGEKTAVCEVTVSDAIPSTDFAAPYFLKGTKATLDGNIYLSEVDSLYFQDKSVCGTATWKINATRGCVIGATANFKTGSKSGSKLRIVVLDEEEKQVGDSLMQDYYAKDGDKEFTGTIALPEAGVYTIKLVNIQEWSSSKLNGITLNFVSELPKTLYLKPGVWAADGAKFAVWDITNSAWSDFMTLAAGETDIYTTTVSAAAAKVIFVRLNSAATTPDWDLKWNQTADLDLVVGKDLYVITDWETGAWAKLVPDLENGFYLVGTFGGEDEWEYANLSAAKKFAATEVEGEYTLNYTLAKDDRFKAVYVENDAIKTWYPEGTGNDYLVTEWTAGEKTIYFRPSYHGAWEGHFYIEANKPEVTYSDFEIVLYEGQLGTDTKNPNNAYLTVSGEQYTYSQEMPLAYNAYLTSANYNGNQHGYTNFVVTMPVEAGNYKVTLGTCQYGNGAGSIKKADDSETYKTFNQNIGEGKNYKANPAEYIVSTVFSVAEAQMIKIVCGNYTPYIKVEKVTNIEYAVTFAVEEGVRGIVPAPVAIVDGESLTIPANTTLYLDGHTLTGWSDGENTYAPGDVFTPKADATLTAVFAENTASLLTATVPVTVQWNFGLTEGAPTVAWEGENKGMGFLVAQATIGETKVDVPLDVDATKTSPKAKFSNSGRNDYWAQVNAGTKLYFPAKKGAEVEVFTYADPATTTVDKANQTGTWTDNKSQFITTATIDASIMEVQENSYYRYLKVTYPASEATAISNTETEVKAQKVIENGQIFILKNGVKYNVLGASVK